MLLGKVMRGVPRQTDFLHDKHPIDSSVVPGDTLPDYVHGAAAVISGDVAAWLAGPSAPRLTMPDDVMLSVILRRHAVVAEPRHTDRFWFLGRDTHAPGRMEYDGSRTCRADAVVSGEFTAEEMVAVSSRWKRRGGATICEIAGPIEMERYSAMYESEGYREMSAAIDRPDESHGSARLAVTYMRKAIALMAEASSEVRARRHEYLGLALQVAEGSTGAAAAAAFASAVELDPSRFASHRGLAVFRSEKNELARARDHYRDALRLVPDNHNIHVELGQVEARSGLFNDAAESFKSAAVLLERRLGRDDDSARQAWQAHFYCASQVVGSATANSE